MDAVLEWATGKTEEQVRVRETGARVSLDPARLERVRGLLSHQVPDGNLRDVLAICVNTTIAVREKRRVGGGHKKSRARGRYVPSFIRRQVWERYGEWCAFVAGDGRRCGETRWLELHHVLAFAQGGATTAENLSVRCRAHNLMHARDDFGDQRPARICFSRSPRVAM